MLTVSIASAHDPYIEGEHDWGEFDEPYEVIDSAISYAFYGYLEDDDVDVFRINFAEADELLRVNLLVPVCGDHYTTFHPYVALLGDVESAETSIELPFDIPEGLGVLDVLLPYEAEARVIWTEPFGGTEYYDAPTWDFDVPVTGDYYVVVFHPEGLSGDYTLATGYEERFESPADQMVANVITIRQNAWLHRDCELSPDDPNAIINVDTHDHEHEDHDDDDHHHHEGDGHTHNEDDEDHDDHSHDDE